jgi:tRNA threonylcarbamoyladenosine biosynthesis protein TsaE
MKQLIATDLSELAKVAQQLIPELLKHKVMALYGPMGAGKTTLVSAMANLLEVEDTISSPSYALHHQYRCKDGLLNHFDFYRLNSISEAHAIGAEDFFFSGALCLIEWPERVEALLPENVIRIQIEVNAYKHRIFRLLI